MHKRLIMAAAALVLVLPLTATAQTADPAAQPNRMTGQQGDPTGLGGTTGLGGAAGSRPTRLGEAPWQASNLMGAPVLDNQGTEVGSITDFSISEDGDIEEVWLGGGGQTGMGTGQQQSARMRVDFDELSFEQGSGGFKVDKSADELRRDSQQQ